MINSFFLIGPMGVGKTTVGQLLAKKINFQFIDSDQWIEEQSCMVIPQIFSEFGEEEFRNRESNAIASLTTGPNVVLSTGGGCILRQENRENLLNNGTVVFLDSSPEKIFERIKDNHDRPLLQTSDPLSALRSIYEARKAYYLESAHYYVNTDHQAPKAIAELLACLYNDPINFISDGCKPLKK